MTTSINLEFGSPDFKIPGLESKFDFIGVPNSFVRCFEAELNRFEVTVLYQLLRWHSWSNSGIVLRSIKWIYKSVAEMIEDAFCGIKPGKLYRALNKLVQQGFLLKEQLHREHFGDVHACAAYNRRYYYSPIMELVMERIVDTLTEESPQTLVNLGFSISENQVGQNGTTDFSKQKNNTHTTSASTPSPTPPLTPPGENREGNPTKSNSQSDRQNQTQGNPKPSSQNASKPQPVPFTDVVARPPDVEQKINKNKLVVQEPVRTEVLSSEPSYKSEPTPKTRGRSSNTLLAGPWKDVSERDRFCQALKTSAYIRGKARDLEAFVSHILKKLSQGIPSAYWDDFIAGEPIGFSSRKEWENADGEVDPKFIEYLAEQLIKGNNSQTATQAADRAFWTVTHDPNKAKYFYKRYKRSIVSVSERITRDRANGISNPATPVWTKDRPQPSDEEVLDAVTNIVETNQQSQKSLEAARHQSRKLQGERDLTAPKTEELNSTQEKPQLKKPSLREYAAERWGGSRPPLAASPVKSSVSDDGDPWQPTSVVLDISQMSVEEINKALADPVLNADLTPQIMRSDFGIITDYLGKITAVKEQLERQSDLERYSHSATTTETESSSSVENQATEEVEAASEDKEAKTWRTWYAHAQKLGYCSDHQMRQGERWVNMNGSWELWQAAVERGYSLEYLARKIREASESTFVPESDWYD